MINLDEYVSVAKLGKAHGLKGEIRMFPFSGMAVDFSSCSDVVLFLPGGESRKFTLASFRLQSKYSIVRFSEVSSREEAEFLTGAEILLKEDLLPRTDDAKFWYEYEDVPVFTEDGRDLGRVKRVFETGAHPIMVVRGNGQEYMIPVTSDIVVDVDLSKGKITISPPTGLLEIND